MPLLPANEIQLWFVFVEDVRAPELYTEYRKLLSDEERLQERRFHFARHQRQYLITRALVRTVLSRYAPVRPEHWRFSKNAYGRPAIHPNHASASELSFNLSHTDGLILCGVARRRSLGVDVESVRREISLDIAGRFFSPSEVSCLRAIPFERQHECFFRFWTLKESYIKAKGQGLSIPLDQFSFSSPEKRKLSIRFDPVLNDKPRDWRFWLMTPSPTHLAAVCAQRSDDTPRLIMRRVVPLHSDAPLECAIVGESD